MIVGILRIDLAVFDAQTLKDKRRVVKGLKQRLKDRFNVSLSETAYHDRPKRCALTLAMVATESRAVHSQFDQIVELVRRTPGVDLLDYPREFL